MLDSSELENVIDEIVEDEDENGDNAIKLHIAVPQESATVVESLPANDSQGETSPELAVENALLKQEVKEARHNEIMGAMAHISEVVDELRALMLAGQVATQEQLAEVVAAVETVAEEVAAEEVEEAEDLEVEIGEPEEVPEEVEEELEEEVEENSNKRSWRDWL